MSLHHWVHPLAPYSSTLPYPVSHSSLHWLSSWDSQAVCCHFKGSCICLHVTQTPRSCQTPTSERWPLLPSSSTFLFFPGMPHVPHSPSMLLPVLCSFAPVSRIRMHQDSIFLLYIFSLGLNTIYVLMTYSSSVQIHTANNQKSNSVLSKKAICWLT